MKGKTFPLHRFSATCPVAVDTLLQIGPKELDLWVATNPVYVASAAGGIEGARWCDTCFPANGDGTRVSWADLEHMTGLTSEQVIAIIEEARNMAECM